MAPTTSAPVDDTEDDASTNDQAVAAWLKTLVLAVAVAFPVLTGAMWLAITAFTDADSGGALVISVWASFWMCTFTGGAAGTTIYEVRHGDH